MSAPSSPVPYGNDGDDDYMTAEERFDIFMPVVQTLVNALGGYEQVPSENDESEFETVYRPGDSVLGVLKDLKKLWRKDDSDDERTVARCMAKAGLMKELIALVKECTPRGDWGRKVALMACDLIAALTWPIDVAKELKEMNEEGPTVTDYASLLRYQLEYKGFLIRSDTLRSVLALLLPHFARQRREEKDDRIISLGLHIVRNMLAIKDLVAPDSATGDKEELSTLQSALIVQLDKLTYLELFVTMGAGSNRAEFNAFNTLVLDILHLIFRGVKSSELAIDRKEASSKQLADMLAVEDREKARMRRHNGTRHSRFGTTITVLANKQRVVLHSQNAINTNPGTVLDENKKQRAQRKKQEDELTQYAPLSSRAMGALQKFTGDFLEAAFNNFMESVLKDIRMERSKIRPADSIRALVVSSFCMDYLLIRREKRRAALDKNGKNATTPEKIDEALPLGMCAVMIELDSVRFVASRMKTAMDDKPPAWTELEASIICFTQILLLLNEMATSTDKEDVEAAEILQNQVYYNGDILDASLQVISQYKNQAVGYLESIVRFTYVLFRMLEKYSKNKAFMFIQKRAQRNRLPRRKKTDSEAPIPEEYAYDEEEDGGAYADDAPSYKEHAFKFTAFEKRLAQEGVANTLVAYLTRYRTFQDHMQFRRVVGLMHRQVVKAQAEGLYFKVSCLHLFQQILDDQLSLPKGEGTQDLFQLIKFVLRKFFKRLEADPFLMIDALQPKTRGKWKGISSYESDEDDGMAGQRGRIREQMGELTFIKSKNLPWSKQVGVAVNLLVKEEKKPWIETLLEELSFALAMRSGIQARVDLDEEAEKVDGDPDSDDDENLGNALRRRNAGPSEEAIAQFEPHYLDATDERHKSPHFRLLLDLLHFQRPEMDLDTKWTLPVTVAPNTIKECHTVVTDFLAEETQLDLEEDPIKYVRRVRKRRVEVDSDGEEVPRAPRPRKRAAEMQTFKSAAFIYDSDDDEATDAAFFAREEELRAQMQALAETQGNIMRRDGGTKKRKRKGKNGSPTLTQLTEGDEESEVGGSQSQRMSDDGESQSQRMSEAGGSQSQRTFEAAETRTRRIAVDEEDDSSDDGRGAWTSPEHPGKFSIHPGTDSDGHVTSDNEDE